MLAENKTIGRYPARATLQKLADSQKAFADVTAFGSFTGLYGAVGVGRNQDIPYTKWGAANAYRLVPPINRAVNLRADAHDSLPWRIIRNATNDKKNDVVVAKSSDNTASHPFAAVLKKVYHHQKNSLFWLMEYADLVFGEIFIEYLKNDTDIVRGLKWLNPLAVTIETRYGEIYRYLYSDLNGEAYIPLDYDDVAYDRFLNPADDWRGLSRVNVVVDKINIYRNTNRFAEAFFKNNAQPGGVVSPPDNETSWTDFERNKIRDEMRRNFQGSDNAFSWMVAPRALNITGFTQANVYEQYQLNDPVMREIYTEFGVPIAMAGDNNGTSYQNNDATQTWFYQNTIIPAARKRQFFINTELLPYFDPYGDSRFEFDTTAYDLVSTDDKTRSDVATANYEKGIWTFNQARVYTKESALGDTDYLKIEGIPVPVDQIENYYRYKLLVKPAPQEAGIVGQELGVNTPEQAQQIEAAKPQGGEFGKSSEVYPDTIPGKAHQINAEDELKAWEKKVRQRGWKAVSFEPVHLKGGVGRWIAHDLSHIAGDETAIKSLFTAVKEWIADNAAWTDDRLNMLYSVLGTVKAYEDTADSFYRDVLATIKAGQQDEISRAKFGGQMRSLLRRYGLQAFRDGMESEGYAPESLGANELKAFRDWQDEQSGYVSNFAKEMFSVGLPESEIESRAQMWTNKSLNAIHLEGKVIAAPNRAYTWQYGDTEHCDTCLRNNGQIKSLIEWKEAGLPQSDKLDCHGFNCQCTLIPTEVKLQ